MLVRRSHRITAAVAAGCCLAGGVAAGMVGGAAAQAAPPDTTSVSRVAATEVETRDGRVSMSSPFIAGVPHVPAGVGLAVGSGGDARYLGPEGSIFNGPADEVDARVDAWWAEQLAAGVSPEKADTQLARQIAESSARTESGEGLPSMSSPFIPGVPHVPSDVMLAVSPGGDARYLGPEGSIFNGPADEVDARVDAWWAEQMAAGVTPEEADRMLADLGQ